MRLRRIFASNFRAFGDGKTAPVLDWELLDGLNILIGENDAGKSAIIDAIRKVLWTTSFETVRLHEQDFNVSGESRADKLTLEATLVDLSPEQESAALEWLTYEKDGSCSLTLHLHAKRHPAHSRRRARIDVSVRSGRGGMGPEIGAAVRELVRATYLRPLRDAEADMRPGRLSRLSQILAAHSEMAPQAISDFDKKSPTVVPTSLVGIMEHAQHHIGAHPVIADVEKRINGQFLSGMSLAGDTLTSSIRVAGDTSLQQILERFELALMPPANVAAHQSCPRGLGYNNALFMATELVLLGSGDDFGLLLVEEPEAHLHPQLQVRVMELLSKQSSTDSPFVQIVISTHSPTLAAGASLEAMTLVHNASTYPLRPRETRLAKSDYEYLQRFLDATKANLFFARAVAIVEGPAESIVLPAIAEMVGLSFTEHGVSIVNVGDVGLYHYARILQRKDGAPPLPVPVACITDRDIVPDAADAYVSKPKTSRKRFSRDYSPDDAADAVRRKKERVETSTLSNVRVFVSDKWTFEYDLAHAGLAKLLHDSVTLAMRAKSDGEQLTEEDESSVLADANAGWQELAAQGHGSEELAIRLYRPLYERQASKAVAAQYMAKLLRSKKYGTGAALFQSLPTYLQEALIHLTPRRPAEYQTSVGMA